MTVASLPNPPVRASRDARMEEWVRRYLPVVYAAARRQLPDAALAQDITQAVFIVLARRFEDLPPDVVLSSWLLRVTHLTCLQARRDAGRRRKHEQRAAQMRPTTTHPPGTTDSQLAGELDAALARLGEKDRSVLTLRYLEQKSVPEVAAQLGINEEAAKKRIGRAMARLRKKLGVTEAEVGTAAMGAFFLMQSKIAVPAHLAGQVVHAMAAAGTAGAATTAAGLLSKGVLKSLFWSGAKIPLGIAAGVAALAVGALLVKQTARRAGLNEAPAPAAPIAQAQGAASNVPGADFPRLDSQGRATFRIYAPWAMRVAVQIGETYPMTRGGDGYWTVTTGTLTPGFHYYNLLIDGAAVADPASGAYFGSSKMMSGLEVPDPGAGGEDFAAERNVPHGDMRARYYAAGLTNRQRQAFVYTPPGYDAVPAARYPVLYLLPGMGEDQRAWVEQGRVGAIMDNLIAQGKARPMIVVMEDAGTSAGFGDRGGRAGRARDPVGSFSRILVTQIIPLMDATYRTIADQDHRALAGVSLGGMQAFQITQDHADRFAYVGAFSAPFGYPAVPAGYNGWLRRPDEFAQHIKLLFFSAGSAENLMAARGFDQQLDNAGIAHVYFEAPGTAHGWPAWRESLHEMAPLLFKN